MSIPAKALPAEPEAETFFRTRQRKWQCHNGFRAHFAMKCIDT